ncbi:MAG: hypothetical protein WBM03_13300, partial [Steroidobacteraceae bacterium]
TNPGPAPGFPHKGGAIQPVELRAGVRSIGLKLNGTNLVPESDLRLDRLAVQLIRRTRTAV